METSASIYSHAITRIPPLSMAQGITTQQAKINVDLARKQHQNYIKALQSLGVAVTILPPEEDFPDSHFVEDAAIIHKQVAILTRPGALTRRGEVARLRPALEAVLTVQEFEDSHEARVDGGDILFMGKYVFIGISDRTNHTGAVRLKALLLKINPELSIHLIRFSGVLHFKSGLTALSNDLLLGNPAMILHDPLPAGKILWLPAQEGYAANVLTINNTVLHFSECTETQKIIHVAGFKSCGLDMSEFRKMDGSFTCLSLLW